jgi:hypothetical protein
MPLWKATAQALVVLFERCGEQIWPIFKAEIDGIFNESMVNTGSPSWLLNRSNSDRSYQEDEKTWRNPGLRETLGALDGLGRGMLDLVQVCRSEFGPV